MLTGFLAKYDALPTGYSEGAFNGQRWGVTKTVTDDKRRGNLYAEQLGGSDHVSFNLYRLSGNDIRLKPCEMHEEKVIDFVLGFEPL